jgi:hypothetical protein
VIRKGKKRRRVEIRREKKGRRKEKRGIEKCRYLLVSSSTNS